jgi:hypothetical protein
MCMILTIPPRQTDVLLCPIYPVHSTCVRLLLLSVTGVLQASCFNFMWQAVEDHILSAWVKQCQERRALTALSEGCGMVVFYCIWSPGNSQRVIASCSVARSARAVTFPCTSMGSALIVGAPNWRSRRTTTVSSICVGRRRLPLRPGLVTRRDLYS